MGYAVFHASKGKGSGGGLGNHIDRVKGKEHTYKHADPSRGKLNVNFIVPKGRDEMPLNKAISARIEEGYNGKRKVRNDAVKYLTHVYTGSHEDMKRIFSDQEKTNQWLKANANFIEKEFGRENIVRLTLHLDEKTPHLHAVTVPLTKDGRLSAKEIMGNKKAMQLRQDRYAEMMKPFGLERGIRGTGIKHENANDYYKRIDQAVNTPLKKELEPVKGLFGIDKAKTMEKYQKSLKSSVMALNELGEKYRRERIKTSSLSKSIERKSQDISNIRKNNKKDLESLQGIIMTPGKSKELREKILANEKEKEIKRENNRGRGFKR